MSYCRCRLFLLFHSRTPSLLRRGREGAVNPQHAQHAPGTSRRSTRSTPPAPSPHFYSTPRTCRTGSFVAAPGPPPILEPPEHWPQYWSKPCGEGEPPRVLPRLLAQSDRGPPHQPISTGPSHVGGGSRVLSEYWPSRPAPRVFCRRGAGTQSTASDVDPRAAPGPPWRTRRPRLGPPGRARSRRS